MNGERTPGEGTLWLYGNLFVLGGNVVVALLASNYVAFMDSIARWASLVVLVCVVAASLQGTALALMEWRRSVLREAERHTVSSERGRLHDKTARPAVLAGFFSILAGALLVAASLAFVAAVLVPVAFLRPLH